LALISTGDRYAVASRGRIDFRETNDALTGSQKRQDKLTQQFERVAALRELARLANRRFDLGASAYLNVLVAENELRLMKGVRVIGRV
jgi:hypothetical protein